MLLGLQPSALIVVAARPGQGKTSFALGLSSHVALETRRPVLFFSMEMGYLELTQRILGSEAGVNARLLRTGKINESDWTKISHAVGRLAEAPLYIDDNPHLTVMDMRAQTRRLKALHGDLGLVVVDYLQLMSSSRRAENRQVEVSELSRGLKILARDLETPVIALSQLNRSLEYRQRQAPHARRPAGVGLPDRRHPPPPGRHRRRDDPRRTGRHRSPGRPRLEPRRALAPRPRHPHPRLPQRHQAGLSPPPGLRSRAESHRQPPLPHPDGLAALADLARRWPARRAPLRARPPTTDPLAGGRKSSCSPTCSATAVSAVGSRCSM